LVIGALTYLYSRIKTMKRLTWFVSFCIVAVSCLNEPDCYQLDNSEIEVAFSVFGFGADKDTLLDVRIPGANVIFDVDTVISSLFLPLNPNTKELEYIFRWKNKDPDTLLLGYSAQIQFVSDECAQRYVFANLTPLRSSFDSVRVFNATPANPVSTNLVIYRCARPDLVGVKFRTKKGTRDADSVIVVSDITADFVNQTPVRRSGSSFYLPLNESADTTIFELTIKDRKVKLALAYTRVIRNPPKPDCGLVTFFTKIKIAETSFDTTATKFTNTASSTSSTKSTSTQDPAIVNFEIFL
jgi:Family of unknown function (DUF6452)